LAESSTSKARSAVFAARVRELREHRGWSQGELARRLAEIGHPIGQSRVSAIEAPGPEPRTVSIDQAAAFARVLNVPLELLLTQSGLWMTREATASILAVTVDMLDQAAEEAVAAANSIRAQGARWLEENGIDPSGLVQPRTRGGQSRPFQPIELTRKEA
jgi:transcriptional regulator with XRE-family HTH domain